MFFLGVIYMSLGEITDPLPVRTSTGVFLGCRLNVSEGDNRPLASLNEYRCFSWVSFKVRSVKLLMSLNKILKVTFCILDCVCVSLLFALAAAACTEHCLVTQVSLTVMLFRED